MKKFTIFTMVYNDYFLLKERQSVKEAGNSSAT